MQYSLEVKREGAAWQVWLNPTELDGILEEFFYLQAQSHDFQELRIIWTRPDE